MTLDLNQLEVETFDIGDAEARVAGPYMPIVSTDQVPHCDGATANYC